MLQVQGGALLHQRALLEAAPVFSCTPSQLANVTALVGGDANAAAAVCGSQNVAAVGPQNAVITWTVGMLSTQQESIAEVAYGLDTSFVLFSSYQVFVMQAGFALYAAGVVRAKNVHMILLKNFMDAAIASMTFYLIGYGLAFGDKNDNANGFIGNWDFALSSTMAQTPSPSWFFFWNWAFCAASTTILSGSIAERATFHSYLMYSCFMTIWVYPAVAHWLWAPKGWLSPRRDNPILGSGAIDFAGSGVVHMVGGWASIMASIATGPRIGRFDGSLSITAFKGSSASLYVLGTLLLWYGWYGFNPGSNLGISNYILASSVPRTAICTTLSAGAGAVCAMLLSFWRTKTWDLLQACTGALAGMVAVTAGCGIITPWAAIICGAVSAPIYLYGDALMERLQIDDPVGAFPVHGLCGVWGVLYVGLMGNEQYIVELYGKQPGQHLMGIFYGGHGQLLLCQFLEIISIIAWSSFWIGGLFFLLRYLQVLRVPAEVEAQGMDGAGCGSSTNINPKNITKFTGPSGGPGSIGVGGSYDYANPLSSVPTSFMQKDQRGAFGIQVRMGSGGANGLNTITEHAGATAHHGGFEDVLRSQGAAASTGTGSGSSSSKTA